MIVFADGTRGCGHLYSDVIDRGRKLGVHRETGLQVHES